MEHSVLTLTNTVGLFLLAFGASVSQASTNCSGTLSGTHNDVIVDGASCTLSGATVWGLCL